MCLHILKGGIMDAANEDETNGMQWSAFPVFMPGRDCRSEDAVVRMIMLSSRLLQWRDVTERRRRRQAW